MLVPDIIPYRIIGKLGINKRPKFPEAVKIPRLNFSGYPSSCKTGYSRPPSAIIVTPEAPVKAVKIAHETSVTMPSPPGSQPKKALDRFTNLFGVLLSANK